MQKTLLLIAIAIFPIISFAQKTSINRKVAQKNYEGYVLMQEKKHKEALAYFNDAIVDDPEAYFVYQNRAVCYLNIGDTTRAINDFKTNIKLDPKNAENRFTLGNILKNRNDTTAAIGLFKEVFELIDTSFAKEKLLIMNRFLGNVYFTRQQYDTALVYFNQLKIIDSMNSSVFISSAACNFYLNQTGQFCNDAERAFVLGGAVTCQILFSHCKGCAHLKQLTETPVSKLNKVDKRLAMVIERDQPVASATPDFDPASDLGSAKIKVYYNSNWQICLPDDAAYYRESFWSGKQNFFGGDFKDYYNSGELFSEGTIDRKKMTGAYKSFYKNGQVQILGQFANGGPVGKWIFYLENGTPDYEIDFQMDDFSIRILSSENQNYAINTGTGNFYFFLEKWGDKYVTLKGGFKNFQRDGVWEYSYGSETIASETYREGKFKKGYFSTQNGQQSMQNSFIKAPALVPPHLSQIGLLLISSEEATDFYPFIYVNRMGTQIIRR